jgi:hypothetical protein
MLKPAGIHIQWVEDEAVVLNEESGELHYLNTQSALIYALLLEFGMPDALNEAVERIDGPPDEIREEIHRLIATFTEKGILSGGQPGP